MPRAPKWRVHTKKKPRTYPEKEVLHELSRRVKKLRLRLFPRPLDRKGEPLNPRLPPDLTMLNDIQLGRLYTEFCAVAQWIQVRKAIYTVERAIAKQIERRVRAEIRLSKSGTVSDKNDQTDADRVVQEWGIEVLKTEGTEVLTDAVFQGYLIGKDACSRELSRRTATMDRRTST